MTTLLIDFAPVKAQQIKLHDYAGQFTRQDLRQATGDYLDAVLDIIADMDDADLTHDPKDPDADDPYAKPGEERIGWSLAHLVLHITASIEEAAAFGSILARGVSTPEGLRLRYEPEWRTFTTRTQVIHRLEESRRMSLAYLEAWPDKAHMDAHRTLSARAVDLFGEANAPTAHLLGLLHARDHLDQLRDVHGQVVAARAAHPVD